MTDAVVDALATYRLTRLVTRDRVTYRLRKMVVESGGGVAEFVGCDWCVGMWVAFGVVAARQYAPRAWQPVAYALALSAVTGLIAENT